MSSWSNDETLAFLDLYRNERDIWDPKSKYYKDRIKINEAWSRISKTMNIKVSHLKRRKDILMATYRTIRRKLKQSSLKKGGFHYKPTWVFYESMEGFLKEIYDCVNPYYTPSEYRITSKYLDGNEAWDRISYSMGLHVSDLKKHKEALMTAFRLHYKRKRRASLLGKEYNPTWIFYEPMELFLNDVYENKSFPDSESKAMKRNMQYEEYEELEEDSDDPLREELDTPKYPKKQKTSYQNLQNVHRNLKTTTLNQVIKSEQPHDQQEDECDIYGKLTAIKLRRLAPLDRLQIMYEIDGRLRDRKRNNQSFVIEN